MEAGIVGPCGPPQGGGGPEQVQKPVLLPGGWPSLHHIVSRHLGPEAGASDSGVGGGQYPHLRDSGLVVPSGPSACLSNACVSRQGPSEQGMEHMGGSSELVGGGNPLGMPSTGHALPGTDQRHIAELSTREGIACHENGCKAPSDGSGDVLPQQHGLSGSSEHSCIVIDRQVETPGSADRTGPAGPTALDLGPVLCTVPAVGPVDGLGAEGGQGGQGADSQSHDRCASQEPGPEEKSGVESPVVLGVQGHPFDRAPQGDRATGTDLGHRQDTIHEESQSPSSILAPGPDVSIQEYPGAFPLAGPLGHLVSLDQIAPHSTAAGRPLSESGQVSPAMIPQAETQVGSAPDAGQGVNSAVVSTSRVGCSAVEDSAAATPGSMQASGSAASAPAVGATPVGPVHVVAVPPVSPPHEEGDAPETTPHAMAPSADNTDAFGEVSPVRCPSGAASVATPAAAGASSLVTPGEYGALPPTMPDPMGISPAAVREVKDFPVLPGPPPEEPPALQITSEAASDAQPSQRTLGGEVAVAPGLALGLVQGADAQSVLEKLVKDAALALSGKDFGIQELLSCGKLAGQVVAVWPTGEAVPDTKPTVTGTVSSAGVISCACSGCTSTGTDGEMSCVDFEKHGSRDEASGKIVLSNFNVTLEHFVDLVRQQISGVYGHDNFCLVCKSGGELMCCDGCTSSAHTACVGLETVPQGDWFCEPCTTAGRAPAGEVKAAPVPKPGPPVVVKRQMTSRACTLPGQGLSPKGRIQMVAPSARGSAARRERNSNKHKRLFEYGAPGALQDGERVTYRTSQGEDLMSGTVVMMRDPNKPFGIRCSCCNDVISCSQFESHAGKGSRRAPYDNIVNVAGVTLRKVAEMMPTLEEDVAYYEAPAQLERRRRQTAVDLSLAVPLPAIHSRCTMLVEDLEEVYGGCRVCHSHDFQKESFGNRTIIICEQCEQEYHVECLVRAGHEALLELPEGNWFCSAPCEAIHKRLAGTVGRIISLTPEHCWLLLHGRDDSETTENSLGEASVILQESFNPIIDQGSGQDLMAAMVYAESLGEWDYRGFFTALLFYQGVPVCAAVARVFGSTAVEVPLVATRLTARRQGHARVLMTGLESFFAHVGVKRVTLPAAYETINTWVNGFGYAPLRDPDLKELSSDLRMLIFPGTSVLHKELPADIAVDPTFITVDEMPKAPLLLEGPASVPLQSSAGQAGTLDPASNPETPGVDGVASRGLNQSWSSKGKGLSTLGGTGRKKSKKGRTGHRSVMADGVYDTPSGLGWGGARVKGSGNGSKKTGKKPGPGKGKKRRRDDDSSNGLQIAAEAGQGGNVLGEETGGHADARGGPVAGVKEAKFPPSEDENRGKRQKVSRDWGDFQVVSLTKKTRPGSAAGREKGYKPPKAKKHGGVRGSGAKWVPKPKKQLEGTHAADALALQSPPVEPGMVDVDDARSPRIPPLLKPKIRRAKGSGVAAEVPKLTGKRQQNSVARNPRTLAHFSIPSPAASDEAILPDPSADDNLEESVAVPVDREGGPGVPATWEAWMKSHGFKVREAGALRNGSQQPRPPRASDASTLTRVPSHSLRTGEIAKGPRAKRHGPPQMLGNYLDTTLASQGGEGSARQQGPRPKGGGTWDAALSAPPLGKRVRQDDVVEGTPRLHKKARRDPVPQRVYGSLQNPGKGRSDAKAEDVELKVAVKPSNGLSAWRQSQGAGPSPTCTPKADRGLAKKGAGNWQGASDGNETPHRFSKTGGKLPPMSGVSTEGGTPGSRDPFHRRDKVATVI